MYVVTKTHNFDPETDAALFDSFPEAESYLQRYWEDYYNEEIANESELIEEECYHEDDYAKITWADRCVTEFHLIKISPPRV